MKKLNNKAQGIVEYALILGFIVLAIFASMQVAGNTISDMFNTLNAYLSTVS